MATGIGGQSGQGSGTIEGADRRRGVAAASWGSLIGREEQWRAFQWGTSLDKGWES